jgi:hypothetical protein
LVLLPITMRGATSPVTGEQEKGEMVSMLHAGFSATYADSIQLEKRTICASWVINICPFCLSRNSLH